MINYPNHNFLKVRNMNEFVFGHVLAFLSIILFLFTPMPHMCTIKVGSSFHCPFLESIITLNWITYFFNFLLPFSSSMQSQPYHVPMIKKHPLWLVWVNLSFSDMLLEVPKTMFICLRLVIIMPLPWSWIEFSLNYLTSQRTKTYAADLHSTYSLYSNVANFDIWNTGSLKIYYTENKWLFFLFGGRLVIW